MKFSVVLSCLSIALAGCYTLPTAGPTAGQVVDQAVKDGKRRFDVVNVNADVVAALLSQPKESFRTRFQKYGKPPEPKIGVGDTVSVAIWEAAAGGLFSPPSTETPSATQTVSTGSHNVTIPDQVVTRDGAISVPFAGRISVAGRSPLEVQREIEERLAGKAIEPQVIVTVDKSVTNTATVSGEVVSGARVPLSVGGDRLLDLIAAAGGAKAPVYATFVRLSRDGVTVTMPMSRLVSNPAENIYAWPGDVVTLVQIPQTYSVFGATGQNTQLDFNAEKMTLAEAVARAGGLQDQRADPSGVFLFRYEPPAVVGALGAGNLASGPDRDSPVVYRLDFRDPNSYFLADRFPVEDKDIIYVSNALLSDLQKFFTLLNTVTGPVVTGIVVTRSVNP
ncbi:MAG TPA: polysaccharide biosynthesis/export family protein [Stellaceae bacterium]|jgi:polysaccharide export outer membrane protein|nr:polysaccharide biosynthesis/export family protein [Stellaceae bacterium]